MNWMKRGVQGDVWMGGSLSVAWPRRHRRARSGEWQSPCSLSRAGSGAAPWLSGGVSDSSLCLSSAPQLHSQLLVARTGSKGLLFLQTPGPGLVTTWGMHWGLTSALPVTAAGLGPAQAWGRGTSQRDVWGLLTRPCCCGLCICPVASCSLLALRPVLWAAGWARGVGCLQAKKAGSAFPNQFGRHRALS